MDGQAITNLLAGFGTGYLKGKQSQQNQARQDKLDQIKLDQAAQQKTLWAQQQAELQAVQNAATPVAVAQGQQVTDSTGNNDLYTNPSDAAWAASQAKDEASLMTPAASTPAPAAAATPAASQAPLTPAAVMGQNGIGAGQTVPVDGAPAPVAAPPPNPDTQPLSTMSLAMGTDAQNAQQAQIAAQNPGPAAGLSTGATPAPAATPATAPVNGLPQASPDAGKTVAAYGITGPISGGPQITTQKPDVAALNAPDAVVNRVSAALMPFNPTAAIQMQQQSLAEQQNAMKLQQEQQAVRDQAIKADVVSHIASAPPAQLGQTITKYMADGNTYAVAPGANGKGMILTATAPNGTSQVVQDVKSRYDLAALAYSHVDPDKWMTMQRQNQTDAAAAAAAQRNQSNADRNFQLKSEQTAASVTRDNAAAARDKSRANAAPSNKQAEAYQAYINLGYSADEAKLASLGMPVTTKGAAITSSYVPNNGIGSDGGGMVVQKDAQGNIRTIAVDKNGKPISTASFNSEGQVARPGAAAASQASPKIGEVRSGYRFTGGDPNKKTSWVAAQ
jgi:hypothetical protein